MSHVCDIGRNGQLRRRVMSVSLKTRLIPLLSSYAFGIAVSGVTMFAFHDAWGLFGYLPFCWCIGVMIKDVMGHFRYVVWQGSEYPYGSLVEVCPTQKIADKVVRQVEATGRHAYVRMADR